jgi:hypothetical protein
VDTETIDLQDLSLRVSKLERQNRFFKKTSAVLLTVLAAIVAGGQAPPHRALEAEKFVLLDSAGRPRIKVLLESVTLHTA